MVKSNFLRGGLWLVVLGGGTAVGWSLRERRLDLMASDRGGVYTYDDGNNGGASKISNQTGPFGWRASLQLSLGFAFPYAAVGTRLAKGSRAAVVDATDFDSLILELRSRRQKTVRIYVKTFDPERTDTLRDLTYPLLEGGIGVERDWSRKAVALRDFAIPLWWFQVNDIPPRQQPEWLAQLSSVDLLNGGMEPPTLQDTLEVRKMELVGRRWTPLALAMLVAIGLGIAVEWHYARGRRKTTSEANSVAGLPVDLPQRQDLERDALLAWIAANYVREDISVEMAGRGTGIHPRKVAGILKAAVGKTFPAHVNDLRLTESVRLLRESDRNVSEIASAVGIGNIPHFHRLFKTRFGVTPREWRAQGTDR
ncbi:MAG: hypothetical protein RL173_1719 [Fibrobacterota bacterium]